jgi:hypothetical protein
MTGKRIIVVLTSIAATLTIAATAAARQRWPVIGCNDNSAPYLNRYAHRYKPRHYCETGGSLGSLEGIDHATWRRWGDGRAYATGYLVDGLGFEYKARITAYKIVRTHDFLGTNNYASWYRKLHVVADGGFRGGVFRGPFDVTIDCTPWE